MNAKITSSGAATSWLLKINISSIWPSGWTVELAVLFHSQGSRKLCFRPPLLYTHTYRNSFIMKRKAGGNRVTSHSYRHQSRVERIEKNPAREHCEMLNREKEHKNSTVYRKCVYTLKLKARPIWNDRRPSGVEYIYTRPERGIFILTRRNC